MFVRKSLPETTILLHRETIEKHGSHNQASHGRKGSGGNSGASGLSSADLRELARLNFGNSGSKKGLKRGDTLDNIKNAEGVRVKISGGSALDGKKGRVVQSAPSGKFHGVKTDDGEEGYINGADLTVISLEKSIDINIEKHGSHNQASHGRRGGRGGGGSSSGGSKPKPNTANTVEYSDKLADETIPKLNDNVDSILSDLKEVQGEADSMKEIRSLDTVMNGLNSAKKDWNDAKSLTGQAKLNKLQTGYNKYDISLGKLNKIQISSRRTKVGWIQQGALEGLPQDEMRELGLDGEWDI
jgi:hypothetical protein